MRSRWIACAALAVALVSCETSRTELKDVQVAPQPPPQRPTKVLVIGLTGKQDVRATFESDMSNRLQMIGLTAVQGRTAMPPGEQITEDGVRAVVQREGADAVVIARLAGAREQQVVKSSPAAYPFYAPVGFYGYYAGASTVVYQQNYLSTEQVVTLETRLYRTGGEGQLVWRALSDTFDASKPAEVIRSVNEKTVARMRNDGVI
jgi:hypothetical protein